MPQAPAQDPDQIIKGLGGTISAPDAPFAAPGDPDAIIRKLGGTITPTNESAVNSTVPPPPTPPPTKPPADTSLLGVGKRLAEPFDPRKPEGRRNIMGAAGSAAALYATGGTAAPTVIPWIAGILGAGSGGMLAEAGEQVRSTFGDSTGADAAPVSGGSVLLRGAEQAAYEAAGRAFWWPLRKVGTMFSAAPRVAQQAGEWVEANLASAKAAAEDLSAEALAKGRAYLKGVRAQTRADVAAARATAAQENQIAAENARMGVDAARKVYDNAAIAPEAAIQGAREGVAKLTRTTAPRGGSQVALDMGGRKVEASAQTGPALPIAPVQQAIEQMLVEAHPGTIFQPAEKTTGIGFIDSMRARRSGEAAAGLGATSADIAKFKGRLVKAGINPDELDNPGIQGRVKELTNILARVMTTKEKQIPFADMHQLKMLLDESVNWDAAARKAMERITKGARQVLREQLAVHEPYNQATAEYAKQVQLYRRGAGKQLIKDARDNPDRVVRLLDPKNPAAAQQIKQLIVEQGTKGGDPVTAQQTWQSLQAAFIFDKVVKGGVEGLSQRVAKLLTETPEGARVILGDPTAQRVLSNYDRIGQAFETAKTLGDEFVAKTAESGKNMVGAARVAAGEARITAQEAKQDLTRVAGQKGRAGVEAARAEGRRFAKSSVGQFGRPLKIEDELVDVGVAATHPTSVYGARSIARLLRGVNGAELTEWAAHSDRNTQRLVAVLTSQVPPEVAASLMREMVGYLSSHHDATNTPPLGPPRTPRP